MTTPHQAHHKPKQEHRAKNWAYKRYDLLHIDIHGEYPEFITKAQHYVGFNTDTGVTYALCSETPSDFLWAFEKARLYLGRCDAIAHWCSSTQRLMRAEPSRNSRGHDIAKKPSSPGHQEQNGIAERSGGRTIYEHATTMPFNAGLSLRWWSHGVVWAARLDSITAKPRFGGKSGYERHYGIAPYIGAIRSFGCPCFIYIPKNIRGRGGTFLSRVNRGIYAGEDLNEPSGSYVVFILETNRHRTVRDLWVDEDWRFVTKTATGWRFNENKINAEFNFLDYLVGDEHLRGPNIEARSTRRPQTAENPGDGTDDDESGTPPNEEQSPHKDIDPN